VRAVVKEARELDGLDAAGRLELAVGHAYFEGMLAAFDECERCCGEWSRARETIAQVRRLVERRRAGGALAAGGGG